MDTPTETLPESRAARSARLRREAVDRTRAWRAERRKARVPESRDADRAVTEAAAFLIQLSTRKPVLINLRHLFRVAVIVLVRDGYELMAARRAIGTRLKPRPEHSSALLMPSIALATNDAVAPPKGGSWTQADLDLVRSLPTEIAGAERHAVGN